MAPSATSQRLAERLDDLLPQTQCRQCGFDGCLPYAEALAEGRAALDRCAPGGIAVLRRLADTLGVEAPAAPALPPAPPQLARIVEDTCIGCTKCIAACPMDAIVGAPKYLHTVLPDECTGCELCLPPCPVDCIELVTVAAADELDRAVTAAAVAEEDEARRAARRRARYRAHQARGFRPMEDDGPALAGLETLDVEAELAAALGAGAGPVDSAAGQDER